MSAGKVSDKDNGYARFRELIKKASRRTGVTIGVHAAEGDKEHSVSASITQDKDGRYHQNGKYLSAKKATAALAKEKKGAHPITVLDIAYFHEFGLGVPQRSFLRGWFDSTTAENRTLLRNAIKLVVRGGKTIDEALALVGLKMQGNLQRALADQSLGLAPDSAATVKRKGSSTPLVDTGQLRQSITFLVRDKPP